MLSKNLVLSTALFGVAAAFSFGAIASTPIEVFVPAKHIYVPSGFDSNDNVEVVLTGELPNLCHQTPMTKVTVNESKKIIDITLKTLKYENDNPFCPPMIVPFTHAVAIGVVDKGNYTIVVNRGTELDSQSKINIAESQSSAVDEHVYARVEYVEKDEARQRAYLTGYNPSDCFQIDKIQLISNGVDTYSVLPIMKKVSDFCPMKMIPFRYEFTVPRIINRKEVLLHVRSMPGISVNSLYYNQMED